MICILIIKDLDVDMTKEYQVHARVYNDITFPLVERMVNLFIQETYNDYDEF